jgi:hypothetical protein
MATPGGSRTWQFHVDLNALRVNELKAGCKALGLAVSGRKEDLVARLLEYYHLNEYRPQGQIISQWLYNCPVHLKKKASVWPASSEAPSSSSSSVGAVISVPTRTPLPSALAAGAANSYRGPSAVKEAQVSARNLPIPIHMV